MYMSSITCEYSKIQCIYLYYAIFFKYIRYIYILSLLLLFFIYNNYWQDQKAGVVDQGQFQLLQSHQPWCPWAEFRALWSEGPCRQRCTQESFLCKRWHTVLAPSTDKLSSLSHQETGCSNSREAQEYNSPSPRLCQWHSHATKLILGLECGRCRLYYATIKWAHLSNCPRAVSGGRPFSK